MVPGAAGFADWVPVESGGGNAHAPSEAMTMPAGQVVEPAGGTHWPCPFGWYPDGHPLAGVEHPPWLVIWLPGAHTGTVAHVDPPPVEVSGGEQDFVAGRTQVVPEVSVPVPGGQ
jgi:hypothetical protein